MAQLEARVETLEKARPGRKALPVVISKEHVCGVDPLIDSKKCPHASLYRRQKGCMGDACVALSRTTITPLDAGRHVATSKEKRLAAIEHLEEGPIYTVYLDAGSFNWLVEILEAKTLTQVWLRAIPAFGQANPPIVRRRPSCRRGRDSDGASQADDSSLTRRGKR